MLRFGLFSFGLCACVIGVAAILDHNHLVVFGPCAGPGAVIIYLALVGTFLSGVICTVLGAGWWMVRRLRA